MSAGHAWSSIQTYSLAEIGTFLRVIVIKNREERAENLSTLWMANNLDHENLQKVLTELRLGTRQPKVLETKEEIADEWKRLRSFMAGKT